MNVQCVLTGVRLTPTKMVTPDIAPLQRLWTCNESAHPCRIDNPTHPRIEGGQFACVHAAQFDDETLGGEHVDTDVDTVHETDLGRAFGYAFMRAFGGEFWFNAMGWFGRYGCHFVISFHPSSHEISPRQVHKILFLQILSLRCR